MYLWLESIAMNHVWNLLLFVYSVKVHLVIRVHIKEFTIFISTLALVK